MRSIIFTATALKDFVEWARTDTKLHQRIATLIFDVLRDPFQGLGKPEPLKHNLKGCWSRRINDEHRLFTPCLTRRFMFFPASTTATDAAHFVMAFDPPMPQHKKRTPC